MVDSLWIIDVLARETMVFAAVGLLIGGIDDLLIDLAFFGHILWRGRAPRLVLADLRIPAAARRIAIFVPAWDEQAVIGQMLSTAIDRFDHPDYRIYVGLYPNDRATIHAAAAIAERDSRIRLVIGAHDGPTTKADCLM